MDEHSSLICQLCDISGHSARYCPKIWHINTSTNDEDLEEECDEEKDLTESSWYTDDLLDQISCLQKLSNQSMRSYFSEAKSLFFALNKVGNFISEADLVDSIVDGLDPSYNHFVRYYHFRQSSISSDDLFHLLLDEEDQLSKLSSPLSLSQKTAPVEPPISTIPPESLDIVFLEPILPHICQEPHPSPTLEFPIVHDNMHIMTTFVVPHFDQSGFLLFQDGTCYFAVKEDCPVPKFELLNSLHATIKGSSCHSSSTLDTSLLRNDSNLHTACQDCSSFFIQMDGASHYFLPTKYYVFYSWFDALFMFLRFLYNKFWLLFIFSIAHGLIIPLQLGLWGRRCKFKLKLRCPTFRLRGRIRPTLP